MKGKYLLAVLLFCWLLGPCVFLWQEHRMGIFGFPLDDAWIHQTYARSIAQGQGWSYAGNPPSAGSTSPLWTLLQAPSFILGLSPVVWSYGLGIALLGLNATLMMIWVRGVNKTAGWFAFLFAIGEWHCIWSALSGMEIILFCCWVSAIACLFFREDSSFGGKNLSWAVILGLGVISGGGIWIRPEAILLSALVGSVVALSLFFRSKRTFALFGIGFLLPLILRL
jgi:hypothetical protein